MKRIHLFELEDFSWFPQVIRQCMTRLILVMHDLLGTHEKIAALLAQLLKKSNTSQIVDLCSGSGGPMPKVFSILKDDYGFTDISLTLTDLYPDYKMAETINAQSESNIIYSTQPLDATQIDSEFSGIRTMIASFHHMPPEKAKQILRSAKEQNAPICIFEISDNSTPILLWWLSIPINILMTLFITPMVRPLTWQQILFTYLIPVIPLCFAWDGAVSNARTYTLSDLNELLDDIRSEPYTWEMNTIKGKGGTKQLYLLGSPQFDN